MAHAHRGRRRRTRNEREEAEDEELAKQLQKLPDLSKALAEAPPELQRQVFEVFELQIA